jgi:hypothetical protein
MTVSYIEAIYNASRRSVFMWAQDSEHRGTFSGENGEVGGNDGDMTLIMFPGARYQASWCGVPWYSDSYDNHYRAISTSKDKSRACLLLVQQEMDGTDGISYYRAGSPVLLYRQVFDGDADNGYTLLIEPGASESVPKILLKNTNTDAAETYLDKVKNVKLGAAAFAQRLGRLAAGLS